MARRWRTAPALAVEGVQTGDGRVIAAGALYWELEPGAPLPLRWDREDDGGHFGAVLVGTIDTLERRPDGTIYAEGDLDDGGADGAELVRILEQRGTLGVSVDLDDVAVEVVATASEDDDDGMMLLLASGEQVAYGRPGVHPSEVLRAAAGDPDPSGDDVVQLMAFDTGEIIERLTRGRVRGATGVDIAAFDLARIELAGAAAEFAVVPSDPAEHEFVDDGDGNCAACIAEDDDAVCTEVCGRPAEDHVAEADDAEPAPVAAAAVVLPPRAVFERPEPELGSELYVDQPGGTVAVPLTIDDDGSVFGHLAVWGACHTGFPGQCVTAPTSPSSYAAFHTGAVRTAEGDTLPVGVLTVGTDHADLRAFAQDARDHYAHTGLAWADVRCVDGEHGPWVSGRLRDGVTDEQVAVLRASSLSGDWRRFDGQLDLVAALAVNTPGFPVRREALAASGLGHLAPAVRRTSSALAASGRPEAMIAAGVRRCVDCEARRAEGGVLTSDQLARVSEDIAQRVCSMLTPELAALRAIDVRTRHLRGAAARHAAAAINAHLR